MRENRKRSSSIDSSSSLDMPSCSAAAYPPTRRCDDMRLSEGSSSWPSVRCRTRAASQPRAAGTSGARTAPDAYAARRRASAEIFPSSRSSITARRDGPETVVSVKAARSCGLPSTTCSTASRSAAIAGSVADPAASATAAV